MKSIVNFFIENYKFSIVLTFATIIFGVMGLKRVRSESYPNVAFSVATVETRYDGASAKDIELKITKPIEDKIRSVSGIKDVRSISQAGRSQITIRVDDERYDLDTVMSDLERAVDSVSDLPKDLKDDPIFMEIKTEEMPVVEFALIGPNDKRQRDVLADLLKEDLEDIKEISSIRMVGYAAREFNVQLDLQKMNQLHISIDEVIAKLSSRNVSIPGGKVKKSEDQKLIRIDGKMEKASDLESVAIRANYNGKMILLSDFARVEDAKSDVPVLAQYNGQDATLLIAAKKAGSDTIKLVDQITPRLERFQKDYPDFKFVIYHDESIKVKDKLSVLSSNAIAGLVLVLVFLIIFLPGRIGVMASLSLPISVMVILGLMPIFDINLNAITILALVIALGMLVDNSVVIAENYARLRNNGYTPKDAVMETIEQLWLPITTTVLTTVASFMPMIVTKGIMGKFIFYIPVIVSLSLMICLIESFFLLPPRLILIDNGKIKNPDDVKSNWFDYVANAFESMIKFLVRFRYISAILFTGLLATSIVMMTVFNKMILFPSEQVEMYVARIEMPVGSTQDNTHEVVEQVAKEISSVAADKIKHLVARSGTSQVGPLDPKSQTSDNVAMILIYVNEDTKLNVRDSEFLALLGKIKPTKGEITFDAMANGPPVGEPVNATVRANSQEQLDLAVNEMLEQLKKVNGVRDVKSNEVTENSEISVQIDYKKAAMLGLSVESIGNAIRTGISGRVVSTANIEGKNVDFKLHLTESQRHDDHNLSRIKVMDGRGNLIPIATVASISVKEGSHQINRFDFKRAKTITAGVKEGQTTAIIANKELTKIYEATAKKYPGLSMVFGGEQESTNESMDSLWSALVLSIIGIFALLVFQFRSFLRPLIILSTIPLGLVGFSIAFAAHQKPISFLALIGVIGLGGIIVNSGIILISFIDELRKQEQNNKQKSLVEVLALASKLRLKAVVVSSLTTISGLMPTAYGIGGSDAMLMPLTLAMAWGLTSGTILTLVWIPPAYAILEDVVNLMNKLFKHKQLD